MAHILKYSEFQDPVGNMWGCNDSEELGKGSAYWWLPARMLGLTPAEYLQWVIDNYKPDKISHTADCSVVWWRWKSQEKMRKFKNEINAMARKRNYVICN